MWPTLFVIALFFVFEKVCGIVAGVCHRCWSIVRLVSPLDIRSYVQMSWSKNKVNCQVGQVPKKHCGRCHHCTAVCQVSQNTAVLPAGEEFPQKQGDHTCSVEKHCSHYNYIALALARASTACATSAGRK